MKFSILSTWLWRVYMRYRRVAHSVQISGHNAAIHYQIVEADLRIFLLNCGEILALRFDSIEDNKSRFICVDFTTDVGYQAALRLNGEVMGDRKMQVRENWGMRWEMSRFQNWDNLLIFVNQRSACEDMNLAPVSCKSERGCNRCNIVCFTGNSSWWQVENARFRQKCSKKIFGAPLSPYCTIFLKQIMYGIGYEGPVHQHHISVQQQCSVMQMLNNILIIWLLFCKGTYTHLNRFKDCFRLFSATLDTGEQYTQAAHKARFADWGAEARTYFCAELRMENVSWSAFEYNHKQAKYACCMMRHGGNRHAQLELVWWFGVFNLEQHMTRVTQISMPSTARSCFIQGMQSCQPEVLSATPHNRTKQERVHE